VRDARSSSYLCSADKGARKLVLVDYLGTFLVLASSVLVIVRGEPYKAMKTRLADPLRQLSLNWYVQVYCVHFLCHFKGEFLKGVQGRCRILVGFGAGSGAANTWPVHGGGFLLLGKPRGFIANCS
jgi:hypothetical protein